MQARAHKMANRLAPKTLIPPKSEINPPKRTKKNGDNQETFLQKPSPINQLTKQKHRQICGEKKTYSWIATQTNKRTQIQQPIQIQAKRN